MGKTKNDRFEIQRTFWKQLQQAKFDINYYSFHFSRCVNIMRIVKYTVIGLTTLFTGVWMSWNHIEWVSTFCAIAVVVLQVFSAISDLLPYDKRKLELREMTNELDKHYIIMESIWRQIAEGELTKQQINNLVEEHYAERLEIKSHYFKNDFLPEVKSVFDKAAEKTTLYFKQMTGACN